MKKNSEGNKQQNSVAWSPESVKQLSPVSSIDNTSNLKDVLEKVYKLGDLWVKGTTDANLIRHIPGLSNVSRERKIFNIVPKKAYATSTYTDKKTLDFTTELVTNTHTNCSNMRIVLPIQIKKSTDKTATLMW